MLLRSVPRTMLNRTLQTGSLASAMMSRERRGGFLQFLLPAIGALAPTVIDWISNLFGGKKKEEAPQEGSGIPPFYLKPELMINDMAGSGIGERKLTAFNNMMIPNMTLAKLMAIAGSNGVPMIGKGVVFVKRRGGFLGKLWEWGKNAIGKVVNFFKPVVTKAVDVVKRVAPRVKEMLPQIVDVGKQIYSTVKDGDFSRVGDIISSGKDLINRGVDIGKDVYNSGRDIYDDVKRGVVGTRDLAYEGMNELRNARRRAVDQYEGVKTNVRQRVQGIKEFLNQNQRLRSMEDDYRTGEIARDSAEEQLHRMRASRNASRVVASSTAEAYDPNLRSYGGETVPRMSRYDEPYDNYEGSGIVRNILKRNKRSMLRGKGFKSF